MVIERLDGFTADGLGNVIQGDPEPGDVVRINGRVEQRYYPAPLPPVLVPSDDTGRDLRWDEFLDVGMGTDATKTNAILSNMPVVAEYGRKYIELAGIKFADASNPEARLARLMAAAKAAGLIDDAFLVAFVAKWVELFPAMVPES